MGLFRLFKLKPLNLKFAQKGIISSSILAFATTAHIAFFHPSYANAQEKPIRIFSWGSDRYFQTGLGTGRIVPSPSPIPFFDDKDVKDVACNGQQSIVLTENGQIFSFGRGEGYRLGHGSDRNEAVPRLIDALKNERVVHVAAGEKHFAAVTENGDLWTWGNGYSGQLGHTPSKLPQKVNGLPEIKSASCGRSHTLVLTKDGRVFSCGNGGSAALGHGDRQSRNDFTEIKSLSEKGVVITQVAAGEDFSLFLSKNGNVFSCGASDFGQTGLGQDQRYYFQPQLLTTLTSTPIEKIATKYMHTLAYSKTGEKMKVFGWGLNKSGQLGLGDTSSRDLPCEVKIDSDMGEGWRIVDLDVGESHSAALVEKEGSQERKVFVFGDGRYGQLGRGKTIESIAAQRTTPLELKDTFEGMKPIKITLGSEHSVCLCQSNK